MYFSQCLGGGQIWNDSVQAPVERGFDMLLRFVRTFLLRHRGTPQISCPGTKASVEASQISEELKLSSLPHSCLPERSRRTEVDAVLESVLSESIQRVAVFLESQISRNRVCLVSVRWQKSHAWMMCAQSRCKLDQGSYDTHEKQKYNPQPPMIACEKGIF